MLPVVGMSPGNSYFKHKEVAFLLKETIKKYGKTIVMVADDPAVSTYLAMGYNLSKAKSKARLGGNALKNRTKSVLKTMGLDSNKVIIVDRVVDVKENEKYQIEFQKINTLYQNNIEFQRSVLETSQVVLQNSGKDFTDVDVEGATHYLLSEMAFLEFAPDYFGEKEIDYVYHKPWRVFEDYIAGIFDGKIRKYLDFILLESPYETFLSVEENNLSRFELIKQRCIIKCGYVPYKGDLPVVFTNIVEDFAKKNSLKLEFVEQCGYGVIKDRINMGYIDMFCSPVWPTKSRRLDLFFSESIAESNVYAYLLKGSKYANIALKELKTNGKIRIVVKENDIHHDIVKEYFPNARIVRLPQLSPVGEEIRYVLDNRADIAFWEDILVEFLLKEQGLTSDNLIKMGWGDKPVEIYENCIALPRGEFELKEMVDESVNKFV